MRTKSIFIFILIFILFLLILIQFILFYFDLFSSPYSFHPFLLGSYFPLYFSVLFMTYNFSRIFFIIIMNFFLCLLSFSGTDCSTDSDDDDDDDEEISNTYRDKIAGTINQYLFIFLILYWSSFKKFFSLIFL